LCVIHELHRVFRRHRELKVWLFGAWAAAFHSGVISHPSAPIDFASYDPSTHYPLKSCLYSRGWTATRESHSIVWTRDGMTVREWSMVHVGEAEPVPLSRALQFPPGAFGLRSGVRKRFGIAANVIALDAVSHMLGVPVAPRRRVAGAQPAQASDQQATGNASKSKGRRRLKRGQELPRLYNDALTCVFSYLPLSSLARCIRVSRDWRHVVSSMPPILGLYAPNLHPPRPLRHSLLEDEGREWRAKREQRWKRALDAQETMLASPLSRHVVQFGSPARLQPFRFPSPLLSFPNLTALHVSMKEPKDKATVLSLPSKLHVLDVLCIYDDEFLSRFVSALSEQLSCLESLTLRRFHEGSSLAPLQRLLRLRTLLLPERHCVTNDPWVYEWILSDLRRLPSLTRVSLPWFDELGWREMARLFAQPHQLQWAHLPGSLCRAQHLPSLTSLSALSSLHCRMERWATVLLLHEFSQLHTLHLLLDAGSDAVDEAEGVLANCALTSVTELHLQCAVRGMTSERFTTLLGCFPALRTLSLNGLQLHYSLRALSKVESLSHSLTSLTLNQCWSSPLPATELQQIRPLHALRTLHVNPRCIRLERADALLYTHHPEALAPLLQVFRYAV
jgi:hypothetical protein